MTTDQKIILGVVGLTLIIVLGFSLLADQQGAEEQERISKPLLGETIEVMSSYHVGRNSERATYNSNPPTSGPHWVGVAGPGIKTEPVPDELLLHSMEHGAAFVWYQADLEQGEVDRIKSAFQGASGKKILVPRVDLDVPVALTSWGQLLKLEVIDEAKIREFIETNNDRAPEKAPI